MDPIYLYLLLNALTLAYPLAQSFEKRLRFYKGWAGLFAGIAIVGGGFIVWDAWFTSMGVWGFNPTYLTGVQLGNLPIEEWLFFLTVPYACVFLYEVMNYFVKRDVLGPYAHRMALGLAVVLLIVAFIPPFRWYTGLTFVLTAAFLLVHALWLKRPWLGRFFVSYAVALVPFFLVNGALTGSFTDAPVVWYNDVENLGIRLFTIPIEDSMYGLLLLLGTVTVYEEVNARLTLGSVAKRSLSEAY